MACADFDVAGGLRARIDRAVRVDNDATCAALAEWRLGAGRGLERHDPRRRSAPASAVGSSPAARSQRGHNGFAGEFGHMVVDPYGPPCVVRSARMLGAVRVGVRAGAPGARGGRRRRVSRVLDLAGGDPEAVRGEHVQRRHAKVTATRSR